MPTETQVIAAVASAAAAKSRPASLDPAVGDLKYDFPIEQRSCLETTSQATLPACVFGDPTGTHTVVLVGDSHAGMWAGAFDAIAKHISWRFVLLAKEGCPVPAFTVYFTGVGRAYTECNQFRTYVMQRVAALHPDLLVLTSAGKDVRLPVNGRPSAVGVDAAWQAALGPTLAKYKGLATKVILLGDTAYPSTSGQECMSADGSDISACNTTFANAVYPSHNQMEQSVAATEGVTYVNTIPWFCTSSICPAIVGDLPVHPDTYHIGNTYALWLSDTLGTALGLLPAA